MAIRVDEEGLLFPIRHWAPWLGAMAVMPFLLAAAGAEDLDAGKPPGRLFSTNCTGCHNSPRGLARDMNARALSDFLRQHYTTGTSTASVLAGYLLGQPGDARGAKPSVRGEETAPAGRSGARTRPAAAAEPAAAPDAQAEAAPDQRPASSGRRRHPTATGAEPPPETTARPAAEAEPASAAPEATPQKPRRKGQALSLIHI